MTATRDRTVALLEEQRQALLEQLDAIDKAIAALTSAPDEHAAGAVLPRRVAPRRVLSDSHKQALVVAKRNARHAHEAAKGLAREMPVDSFVPAIGRRGERQAPRLVKRPISR